jgi:hypothetical protein
LALLARSPQFWGCSKPVSIEESGGGHAQMDDLSFAGSQSLGDLAEGVGMAELQKLAEYVTKSIHTWPSFFVRLVFAKINLSHI